MNEQETNHNNIEIILYRLDKLEEEQREQNKQVLTLLDTIKEGQTQTNQTVVQHSTEIQQITAHITQLQNNKQDIESSNAYYDSLQKQVNSKADKDVEQRVDRYGQVIIYLVGAIILLFLTRLFNLGL